MRRVINTSIIFIIVLAFSFCVTAQNAVHDTTDTVRDDAAAVVTALDEYTVAEAQRQALENNIQTIIDDLDIKSKEKALEKAKENAAMADDVYGSVTVLNNRIRKEVRVMEAETALEAARMTKTDHNEQLKLNVSSTFYNITLTQMELEKESRKQEILREKYEIAKRKYEAMSITEDELETAEYDVFSKSLSIESIGERLNTLDIKLKDLLGLPLGGEPLKIKAEISLIKFVEADIENLVETRLENDTGVYSASGRYNAAKRTMELTQEIFKPDTEIYNNNDISLETALRDYDSVKRSREVNIRNGYNELLNMKDTIELAIKFEELQKKKLDNTKIKYDNGQIGKEQYMTAEGSYLDAVFNKYKAICDFNIKYESFYNLTRSN